MKKMLFILILLFFVYLNNATAKDVISWETIIATKVAVKVGHGIINYEDGYLEINAVGVPTERLYGTPGARSSCIIAEQTDAIFTLYEDILTHVYPNEKITKQKNGYLTKILNSETPNRKIFDLLQIAEFSDINYPSDGSCEQQARIQLADVIKIILPDILKKIKSKKKDDSFDHINEEGGKANTGIVIDATGIGAIPALFSSIVDENGEPVYSIESIAEEYASQYGMYGYKRSLKFPFSETRVGTNPIIVKAIKPYVKGGSDIIIKNADAKKIRNMPNHTNLMKKCNIIIVID